VKNYIKKILHQIFDKWLITILPVILLTFGTAVWDYIQRFYSLPEKVETINQQHKRDSIFASSFIYRIEKIERRNLLDSIYLEEDYRTFNQIKTKLKIK